MNVNTNVNSICSSDSILVNSITSYFFRENSKYYKAHHDGLYTELEAVAKYS